MPFDYRTMAPGQVIFNLAGSKMTFLMHVPKANPACRVVVLAHDKDIVTYNEEGQFWGPHRPSKMDLTTDQYGHITKKGTSK